MYLVATLAAIPEVARDTMIAVGKPVAITTPFVAFSNVGTN